jgi:hypothetical protein
MCRFVCLDIQQHIFQLLLESPCIYAYLLGVAYCCIISSKLPVLTRLFCYQFTWQLQFPLGECVFYPRPPWRTKKPGLDWRLQAPKLSSMPSTWLLREKWIQKAFCEPKLSSHLYWSLQTLKFLLAIKMAWIWIQVHCCTLIKFYRGSPLSVQSFTQLWNECPTIKQTGEISDRCEFCVWTEIS